MLIYVFENGSDRDELIEALLKEGVTYQERKAVTEREAGFSSIGMVEIQANLPEVFPVPPEFAQRWQCPGLAPAFGEDDHQRYGRQPGADFGLLTPLAWNRAHRHKQFPFG